MVMSFSMLAVGFTMLITGLMELNITPEYNIASVLASHIYFVGAIIMARLRD